MAAEKVQVASVVSDEGIKLDAQGDFKGAIEKYTEATESLSSALEAMDEETRDRCDVESFKDQLVKRIAHLQSVDPAEVIPVDKMLNAVYLRVLDQSIRSNVTSAVGDLPDKLIRDMITAAVVGDQGVRIDRMGNSNSALDKYQESVNLLSNVLAAMSDDAPDKPNVVANMDQMMTRIGHLKSCSDLSVPPECVDKMIKPVLLEALHQQIRKAVPALDYPQGAQTLSACVVIGAGLGFLVLGGALGVITGAVTLGLMATRQDTAGAVVRSAGEVGLDMQAKAIDLNEKHHITEKLFEAGVSATTAAQALDEKYSISQKVGQGLENAGHRIMEIEKEYHVTDKVAEGIAGSAQRVTDILSRGKHDAPALAPLEDAAELPETRA
jgi:hypothetical protein